MRRNGEKRKRTRVFGGSNFDPHLANNKAAGSWNTSHFCRRRRHNPDRVQNFLELFKSKGYDPDDLLGRLYAHSVVDDAERLQLRQHIQSMMSQDDELVAELDPLLNGFDRIVNQTRLFQGTR